MSVSAAATPAASLARERWEARRRWSRAAIAYLVMLLFSLVFLGPLLFAALSSVKTDPLAYPPKLLGPQLSPANWAAAASLGGQEPARRSGAVSRPAPPSPSSSPTSCPTD